MSKQTMTVFDRLEAHGYPKQKLVRSAVLFAVLQGIYGYYLSGLLAGDEAVEVSFALPTVVKFLILAGGPFAVLAWKEADWRSEEAAALALGAFGVSVLFWFDHYGIRCFKSAATLFFPFLLAAAVGYHLGRVRHPPQWGEDA